MLCLPKLKNARFCRGLGCRMVKAILFFLLVMVIIAMIGRAIVRASGGRIKPLGVAKLRACPHCGRKDIVGAILGRDYCGCKTK